MEINSRGAVTFACCVVVPAAVVGVVLCDAQPVPTATNEQIKTRDNQFIRDDPWITMDNPFMMAQLCD